MKKNILGLVFILTSPSFVWASCGLRACPMPNYFTTTVDLFTLVGKYQEGTIDATYWSSTLRAEFRPFERFQISAWLPFSVISNSGIKESGISDFTTEVTTKIFDFIESKNEAWLGFQMEFPTGDKDKLLGSGHIGSLPFVMFRSHFPFGMLYAQTGLRWAINAHDHGAPRPLEGSITDPHSDGELAYRIGLQGAKAGPVSLGLAFAAQTILVQDGKGDTFGTVIPEIYFPFRKQWSANIHGDIPVTSNKRLDWRVGAGVSYSF